jgi:hypothetical protein
LSLPYGDFFCGHKAHRDNRPAMAIYTLPQDSLGSLVTLVEIG